MTAMDTIEIANGDDRTFEAAVVDGLVAHHDEGPARPMLVGHAGGAVSVPT